MIQLVKKYINQAQEIAQHFAFYNPEDIDQVYDRQLVSDHPFERSSSSGLESGSHESINKDDLVEIEEEINPSQLTLINRSQLDIIESTSPEPDHERDKVSEDIINATLMLENNEQAKECNSFDNLSHVSNLTDTKINDGDCDSTQQKPKTQRKISWAENMATIINEHLSEESSCINESSSSEEIPPSCKTEQLELDSDALLDDFSEDGSLRESPINNTPTTEYLDFEEVSRQMHEIDSQLDQSESFYAEKCVMYWDARGWLELMEANEYDEDMLISVERHKRILLDRVKTRLQNEARERANRELLFKVQSALELEICCQENAEREANPMIDTPKKESFLLRLPKKMIGSGINCAKSLVSYSYNSAKRALFVSKDIICCTQTLLSEFKNVVLGEEFSLREFQSTLTIQDLLNMQKDISAQIFKQTGEMIRFFIGLWWTLRLKMHKQFYTLANTISYMVRRLILGF